MVVWRESLLDLYHLIGHLRETLLLAVHFIYLLRMMVQKRLLVLELLYVHLLVEADLFRQGLHLAVALTTAGLVVFELGFEGFYTIFERLHGMVRRFCRSLLLRLFFVTLPSLANSSFSVATAPGFSSSAAFMCAWSLCLASLLGVCVRLSLS